MTASPAIELVGIDKRFGAVHANKDIHLSVERGTIHGIVGENGAGKSTLMSIVYGFYEADQGEIRVNGQRVSIRSSQDAIASGIGMVHQHFMLVDPFTVLENVILGAEGGGLLAAHAAPDPRGCQRSRGRRPLDRLPGRVRHPGQPVPHHRADVEAPPPGLDRAGAPR